MDLHTLYNWEHVTAQRQLEIVQQAEQTRLRKTGASGPDRHGRKSQGVVGLVKSFVARFTLSDGALHSLPR